jgi:hypothetical protein
MRVTQPFDVAQDRELVERLNGLSNGLPDGRWAFFDNLNSSCEWLLEEKVLWQENPEESVKIIIGRTQAVQGVMPPAAWLSMWSMGWP